jgi:hypothetical protein
MNQFLIFDLVIAIGAVVGAPLVFHRGSHRVSFAIAAAGLAAAALAFMVTTPAATLNPRTVIIPLTNQLIIWGVITV